jgi:hypothetical protein
MTGQGNIKTITVLGEISGGNLNNTGAAEILVTGQSGPGGTPEERAEAEAAAVPVRARAAEARGKADAAAADLKAVQQELAKLEGALKPLDAERQRLREAVSRLKAAAEPLREQASAALAEDTREEELVLAGNMNAAAAIKKKKDRQQAEASARAGAEALAAQHRAERAPLEAEAAAAEQALKEQEDGLRAFEEQNKSILEAADSARAAIARLTEEAAAHNAEAAKLSVEAAELVNFPPVLPVVKGTVSISGASKIRIENLTVTRIGADGAKKTTVITLGKGAKITGSSREGVEVRHATLIMEGDAEISGCRSHGVSSWESDIFIRGSAKITNNSGRGIYYNNGDWGGNCTLEGNAVISENTGGGILITGGEWKVASSGVSFTLRGNVSITGNGGPHLEAGGGVSINTNQVFIDLSRWENTATMVPIMLTIQGGSITNNTAKLGGGVYTKGTFTMTGGTISGNHAEYGAGVYAANGDTSHSAISDKCTLSGGTITGNEAQFAGGGLYAARGSRVTVGKVSVRGNTSGDEGGTENIFRQQ